MKSTILILAFVIFSSFISTDAIFDGGVITLTGGGALLAAALGLKAAAGIGFLAGSALSRRRGGRRRGGKRRHYRSVTDVEELVNEAVLEDASDCAKRLVCAVNTVPVDSLNEMEATIYKMFGNGGVLDAAKESAQFDLAAIVGRKVGEGHCAKVYARCPLSSQQLRSLLQGQ